MKIPSYITWNLSQHKNISKTITCLKTGLSLTSLLNGVFYPKNPPVFGVSIELDLTSPNISRDVFLHFCSMERVNQLQGKNANI
jgi:hypothetical protein